MTINISNISLSELELPFRPSEMMAYQEPVFKVQGNQLLVGYLVDDDSSDNPLECMDGQGNVYSAHRDSATHSEMQEALGLDSQWEPDLELVNEHLDRLKKMWIHAAANSSEFKGYCDETAGAKASFTESYYLYRARKYWAITDGEYEYGADNIDDFVFTADVQLELWKELREEGVIGNPDLVLLDCYQHSGIAWSVSGEGMQCRWDTSSGAGVWVPDDVLKASLDDLEKLYSFGRIYNNGSWTRASGKKRYYVELDSVYGDEKSEQFMSYDEAFNWLVERSKELKLPKKKSDVEAMRRRGRRYAALEQARHAIELYNSWLNGQTYGIVQATFDIEETSEEPEFSFCDSEECWGFYSDDDAMDELRSQMGVLTQAAA